MYRTEIIDNVKALAKLNLPNADNKNAAEQLVYYINAMMDHHFMDLVQLLYEMDVDENKIIEMGNQGFIEAKHIAMWMIDRERIKIITRLNTKTDIADADSLDLL